MTQMIFRSIVYRSICCTIGFIMKEFLNHQISKGIIANFPPIVKK